MKSLVTRGSFFMFTGMRRIPFYLVCILTLVFLNGCKTVDDGAAIDRTRHAVQLPASGNTALLSIFFNLREPSVPPLTMQLADVEVLIGDAWVQVLPGPVRIDAEEIGAGQVFISRRQVPVGQCRGLRFKVTEAGFRRGERTVAMEVVEPAVEVDFPVELSLERGDSKSIFMTWDVESSLKSSTRLIPVVQAIPQAIPLLRDLAYAACPDINTVYIIRMDRNWVYGSIGIPGRPTYLALDSAQDRLYVLAADEAVIKVIDLNNRRIVDFIRIPMFRRADFMTISSDGLWAFVLDRSNNNLARIDLNTGGTEARVRLNFEPQFLYYLAGRDLLAVSSTQASAVYLLNPLSLQVLEEVPAGSMAQGMAAWEDKLYIAERTSNRVIVYDLDDRLVESQISVGVSPRRILLSDDKLYITNFESSSVSVLLAGQVNIIREINLDSPPLELTHSERWNQLYVGDGRAGGLTVIDTTMNEKIDRIDFQATPLGLAATTE